MTGTSALDNHRIPPAGGDPPSAASDPTDKVYRTLAALRRSFIRIGAVVLVSAVAGFFLAEPMLRYLQQRTGVTLAAYGIPETFFTFLNIALAFGIFVSMPYILYAVLSGVQPLFPALTHRMVRGFWLASVLLFYAGVIFCLNISLPYGVGFLLEFQGPHIEAIISVRKFAAFCLLFLFGFGIIFELPLAMILAGRLGLVGYQALARNRRYALLAITIIAAVLTPTPDAFNLALMAVPLYMLFELGLIGMRLGRNERGDHVQDRGPEILP
ncbi:MAG: twin-arginine translocase subunit TatC [Desulfobacterales bacterium]|jgi:sec-independent protein translocase protein TatC|nr:twin-arginine translocase subunit TatC [Desulfobacterales bacterium]